jgi:hypothetical protein
VVSLRRHEAPAPAPGAARQEPGRTRAPPRRARRAYLRERRKGAAIWLLLFLTLVVGWTIPAAAGLPTLWESALHAFGAD